MRLLKLINFLAHYTYIIPFQMHFPCINRWGIKKILFSLELFFYLKYFFSCALGHIGVTLNRDIDARYFIHALFFTIHIKRGAQATRIFDFSLRHRWIIGRKGERRNSSAHVPEFEETAIRSVALYDADKNGELT